jgi:membrane protease YdiL (CAAX protease family)
MTEAQSPAVLVSNVDRVNNAFAGAGAALGLVVWFYLFPLPFGLASGILAKSHPRLGLMLGLLAMLSVVPGVCWVARSVWGEHWQKAFPLARVGSGLLLWTALSVLALISLQVVWFAVLDRTLGLPNLPDPIVTVGALAVVFGAPIAEEALFRGYGLARIRELGGERRALFFTAAVFALLHLPFGSWVKLPGTFVIGLFLGWLVFRTGSLWPALLGHFTNNAMVFVLSRWGRSAFLDSKPVPWFLILALGAMGVAGLAILWLPQVRGRIRGLTAST